MVKVAFQRQVAKHMENMRQQVSQYHNQFEVNEITYHICMVQRDL